MLEREIPAARPRLLTRSFSVLLVAQACFGYAFSSFFLLPKYLVLEALPRSVPHAGSGRGLPRPLAEAPSRRITLSRRAGRRGFRLSDSSASPAAGRRTEQAMQERDIPAVRPALLTRSFSVLLVAQACFGYAFSSFFLLPKFMANQLHAGPREVGQVLAAHGGTVVILLPLFGAAVDRFAAALREIDAFELPRR